MEETEKGLDGQGIQLKRQRAALTHPLTKDDGLSQGPIELDQTLHGGTEHLEKTHELGSKGAQEVHP